MGPKNISSSQAVREQHGKDESYHSILSPDLVVWPGCTQEVSSVAKLCNQHKIAMVPFGTGTGVEGGVAAIKVKRTSRATTGRNSSPIGTTYLVQYILFAV